MCKSILSALPLLLLLATVASQNCSPSPATDRLVTASYTFQLAPFTSRVQCYNNPVDTALAQPQITTGLTSIASFQADSAGIDFSLRSFILPGSSQASFTLIVNNASWSSVRISYLITSRSDFQVGTFLSQANSLANCNKQQPFSLVINLPPTTSIAVSQSLAVLVFLNGLRTPSTGLNLQFQQPVYDSSLRQINVTAITNANKEIEAIYFAYILVDLAKLSAAGFTFSFSTTMINGNYLISGTVGISNGNAIQSAFFSINKTNSLTCVGFSCTGCQSPVTCAGLGGQVLGSQCVKCTGGQIFLAGVGCACSSGNNLINGVCQACPPGTSYNSATQVCVQVCGTNSFLAGSTCVCSSGFFNISGTCQTCPSGTTYNAAIQTCVAICGANSVLAGTVCVCSSGFFNISGVCQTCPAGTAYNSGSQSCLNVCGVNQIWSNGNCNCINGFTLINNVCQQTTASCGTNMFLSNGICRCLPNLLQYQGACYSCPANSVVTADQSGCMCIAGYTLTSSYTCQLSSQSAITVQSTTSNSGTTGTSSNSGNSGLTTSSTTITSASTSTISAGSTTSTANGGSSTSSAGSTTSTSNGGASTISGSSSTSGGGTSTTFTTGTSTGGIISSSTGASSTSSTTTTSASGSSTSSGGTGGSANTINIYGGNSIISASNTTSASNSLLSGSCTNGAFYSNGTCRPQAAIFTNQSVVILNTIYVNVIVANLPEAITNNQCPSCPSLLMASLINTPSGVTVSTNFISGTTYQWVAAIVFPSNPSTVTLQLRFNPAFSSFFTTSDLSTLSTTVLNPAQIPVYTLPAQTVTNAVAGSKDILTGNEPSSSNGVLKEVVQQFSN